MLDILDPTDEMMPALAKVAAQSFLESHGHSASAKEIEEYVANKFSLKQLMEEKQEAGAIFRMAFWNGEPAAYSKIVLNRPMKNSEAVNICKMDRLYVLEKFLDHNIGRSLMDDSLRIAREHGQKGIWLNVWIDNKRAVRFYEREGFKRVGEEGFKISATHSNPNYIMYRDF
jgi:ribosomal protein S18 acetylase RimI-like enzyme